jgi:hypothetical protein
MIKIKRLFMVILAGLFLSGCATYSVKKGESPYNNGYVVARYDRILPEYTLGKDNSVPDEKIAKERFQRRRKEVEACYKKMGYIENRFKQMFVDPPVFMFQTVLGVFRLPSIAINDYKYNHDSLYRAEVDKKEEAAYKAEKARLKALKDELNSYIQKDLEKNESVPAAQKVDVVPEVRAPEVVKPVVAEPVREVPVEVKPVAAETLVVPQESPRVSEMDKAIFNKSEIVSTPVAVIIAKPVKGFSPLTVKFSAAKSSACKGRIVSYFWDFGDGDTSTKKKTSNTYLSTTYGSRDFKATLTVNDDKGASATSSVNIEVLTK